MDRLLTIAAGLVLPLCWLYGVDASAAVASPAISCEGSNNGNCESAGRGGGPVAVASALSSGGLRSICDATRAYEVPSASRLGASFRSAVLTSELPYNGSVRTLLREWYYQDSLTAGAVVAAAAEYATVPIAIASVVFFLALLLPIVGALWQCYNQQKSDNLRARLPWSKGAFVACVVLLVFSVVTVAFAVAAILASFNSRTALGDVRPTIKDDLKELDVFVKATVRRMQSTLVGRGECLAGYVDDMKRNATVLNELQSQRETLLLRSFSGLAPSSRMAVDKLGAFGAVLDHTSELLHSASEQHALLTSSLYSANITLMCEGDPLGDNAFNATETGNMTDVCDSYEESKNISQRYASLLNELALTVEAVRGLHACVNRSTGEDWTSMVQLLQMAAGKENSSEAQANTSGSQWLQSVRSSMERALLEGHELMNTTLGVPDTYAAMDSVMGNHVERYEEYRHVLSVLLLVSTTVVVFAVILLSVYGFVLLRCQDCGRASVSLSERLSLIGRVLERLITVGYIMLTVLLWTSGWFFIGASLLGAPCGSQRNMKDVLANVVDNPYIWNGSLPLAKQVLRDYSDRYPLTATEVLSTCSARRSSSVWQALHLEHRHPLSQLTGRSVNFGLQPRPGADALQTIHLHLKQYHHKCLHSNKLWALLSDSRSVLAEIQAINASLDMWQTPTLNNVPSTLFTESLNASVALLHVQRHAAHQLINQTEDVTAAAPFGPASRHVAAWQMEQFSSCTGDLIRQPGQCQTLPCLYQSSTRAVCGDFLSAMDAFWLFCFLSGVALWLTLLVAAWISRKYFVEPQPMIQDFSSFKVMAGQLLASLFFGVAWILDLMVTIEFFREQDSNGMSSRSMWLVAIVLLILSGMLGLTVRAVCWVLVDRASGSTDLGEQRNWVHRRHGWQFFGDVGKLALQDVPFFALLVAYCHHNRYVGTVSLIAMIVATIGICYFFVFALLVNRRNTKQYLTWIVSGSRGRQGSYKMEQLPTSASPVAEELSRNGVKLKHVPRRQRPSSSTVDSRSDDDDNDESDADQLGHYPSDGEGRYAASGEAMEVLSFSADEPATWPADPGFVVADMRAPPPFVVATDTMPTSEANTLERRRHTPALRSMTPVRPAKVAPAPMLGGGGSGGAIAVAAAAVTTAAARTRSASTSHYTSGPRSDMTSSHCSLSGSSSNANGAANGVSSSGTGSGNARPNSTALTLDQLLNEWDTTRPGSGKRRKYATWSEAPPAHLMAAIEQEMSGQRQLEGTSTFHAAPVTIIEEDTPLPPPPPPPPPEAGDPLFTLDADVSYAARTASLPTSAKARKRYQQRLMTGTAGPDAERQRQKTSATGVLFEDQNVEYCIKTSSLSIDV